MLKKLHIYVNDIIHKTFVCRFACLYFVNNLLYSNFGKTYNFLKVRSMTLWHFPCVGEMELQNWVLKALTDFSDWNLQSFATKIYISYIIQFSRSLLTRYFWIVQSVDRRWQGFKLLMSIWMSMSLFKKLGTIFQEINKTTSY